MIFIDIKIRAVTYYNFKDYEIVILLINRSNIKKIDGIFVTLDTHHKEHIAFSRFWINKSNEHPKPYTIISSDDIIEKIWYPVNMNLYEYCQSYAKQLESKGRFKLVIWPDHCLLGTDGHEITNRLQSALYKWNKVHENKLIRHIKKGMRLLAIIIIIIIHHHHHHHYHHTSSLSSLSSSPSRSPSSQTWSLYFIIFIINSHNLIYIFFFKKKQSN